MGNLGWHYNRIKSYIGRPRLIVQEKPVILNDKERCETPIFIIGVHRSGTSLVRRMFNSHPEIACPPETYFMENYVRLYETPSARTGYNAFGYDEEAMRDDLARKASDLHEAYRLSQGKKFWADKTPQYVEIIDGLDRLFDRKAMFFFVMRHPADIVFSIYKRGWRFNQVEDHFDSTIHHVRTGIDHMLAFEEEHGERSSRIDYRKLCIDPAKTLSDAMRKLGLEFHEDMLKFGDKSHNYGIEDPVVRGKKTVEASAGAWINLPDIQLQKLANSFGPQVLEEIYWS